MHPHCWQILHTLQVMLHDLDVLGSTPGVCGVVCGGLTPDGDLDKDFFLALMSSCKRQVQCTAANFTLCC